MAQPRYVVAIGGSAGALEPLISILSKLTTNLGLCYLVVIHFPANRTSVLPSLLNRLAHQPTAYAEDGERIEANRIYIAPSDRHLILNGNRIAVSSGPKENACRPSIDVLFRSVAMSAGTRAIGVILSGTLDDGSAGIAAIAKAGGCTIAQDPNEALFSEMPRNAIGKGKAEKVFSTTEIVDYIERLAREKERKAEAPFMKDEDRSIELDVNRMPVDTPFSKPSQFVCPECDGTLWELTEEGAERYRCRVGHAYNLQTLLDQKGASLEEALWTAVRALQEQADLSKRIAERVRSQGHSPLVARFQRKYQRADAAKKSVREILLGLQETDAEQDVEHDAQGGLDSKQRPSRARAEKQG